MTISSSLQLGLQDLIAEFNYARRHGNLGRLALLAYCDARSWGRQAGAYSVVEFSTAMFIDKPQENRDEFLEKIDLLILELERVGLRLSGSRSGSHALLSETSADI
jgi:hypothetical protein